LKGNVRRCDKRKRMIDCVDLSSDALSESMADRFMHSDVDDLLHGMGKQKRTAFVDLLLRRRA